jgi:hypothetical protein
MGGGVKFGSTVNRRPAGRVEDGKNAATEFTNR